MAKYRVKGTAVWPDKHPSAQSTEWEGVYEAASKDEAAALGVQATVAAWPDATIVRSTEVVPA